VFRVIGRPELAEDPNYVDPVRRQERALEVDELVEKWVVERTLDEAMAAFRAADVAAAPIYDARQLMTDEHLRSRGSFVAVDDPDFGTVTVQSPLAQLSDTPGHVEHLGRGLGVDNDAVYGELLGLDASRLEVLRANGVI
jgi:crotonobetainyl-CoA:carnitine CoA-transferase CaiB-like acyl-CoA transferase